MHLAGGWDCDGVVARIRGLCVLWPTVLRQAAHTACCALVIDLICQCVGPHLTLSLSFFRALDVQGSKDGTLVVSIGNLPLRAAAHCCCAVCGAVTAPLYLAAMAPPRARAVLLCGVQCC